MFRSTLISVALLVSGGSCAPKATVPQAPAGTWESRSAPAVPISSEGPRSPADQTSAPGPAAKTAGTIALPNKNGSLRFAVIGDSGTGGSAQYEIGRELMAYHAKVPFEFVMMVGDNIYGADTPADYKRKFEDPYKDLLSAGVKFYAALGNHDNPNQRSYKLFNMNGERYYTFRPKMGIRFFALDSNYVDQVQLDWLEKQLSISGSEWKICFFHHPLYSSARTHGSALATRKVLEPLFIKYGVSAVFSGHEHVYERVKPQNGICYFTSGSAGKLRRGDLQSSALTAKGFDQDFHFMLVEIGGDEMYFQTISRTGETVDSGSLSHSMRAVAK